MMFFTLPLTLALATLVGITVIVWRKMPFLRKLTPESHEVGQTWFHDMAPEAVDWFRSVPWHEYLHKTLVEFEKVLRRIRLVFLAVDRASEQLVRTVRRAHLETAQQVHEHQEQRQAQVQVQAEPDDVDLGDPEQLKQEEQRLIIAIAQSPKEASLYGDIARIYMRMRAYADAGEALEQAVKLEPDNGDFQRRLESARKRLAAQTPTV